MFATSAEAAAGEATALLPVLRDLSEIGVVLLMLVAGLETDVVELRRVGTVAFWSAFGGVVLPLVGGAALAVAFGFPLYWKASPSAPSSRQRAAAFRRRRSSS